VPFLKHSSFLIMQKKALVIAVAVLAGLSGCARSQVALEPDAASQKLAVVTTLFPQFDFARTIGGDKAAVTLLLPPGVEAHAYEPKPSDVVAIDRADLLVYTGEFMEPWAHELIEGIADPAKAVDASAGVSMISAEEPEEGAETADAEEHPWEWAGAFALAAGDYAWTFAQQQGQYADPGMFLAVLPLANEQTDPLATAEQQAKALFSGDATPLASGGAILPGNFFRLVFDQAQAQTVFSVPIAQSGTYAFFAAHHPAEFEAEEHYFKDQRGNDLEPFIEEPAGGSHAEGHHHSGTDPHVWLDFDNARIMAENIARAFIRKDPANADHYQANLDRLLADLAALDGQYKTALAACRSRTIIYGGHYAFGYLSKRYGLEYVAAQGFSPDAEPTAKDMIALVEQVKSANIRHIFYEELTSPKIAETLAQETNARLLLLNGAHNLSKDDYTRGVTFVSIMKDNLANLQAGLDCNPSL
jgi:ABC-type Zn uptake system ZnuABC Zn-binding protein ZnuA